MEVLERQRAFLQRGVAGPFAEAVDRGVDMRGPTPHGSQGVGRGQAEVVVGMHFQLQVQAPGEKAEALVHRERLHHPHRVGEAQPLRAGGLGDFCPRER